MTDDVKTLAMREVFDRVKTHLLTQNARSHVGARCLYRGPGKLKCAVGILIKDEHFNDEFNSEPVDDRRVLEALRASGINVDDERLVELLIDLQTLHDKCSLTFWKEELKNIEKEYFAEGTTIGV
jgi:hypothetical protein